uniref:hypothetical protein n=1 Tax=Neisseria sicca TaxID=490 RepID=UPI001C99C688
LIKLVWLLVLEGFLFWLGILVGFIGEGNMGKEFVMWVDIWFMGWVRVIGGWVDRMGKERERIRVNIGENR